MNQKLHIFGYVLLVSLATQGRARAATWFVDTSAPGGDGTSWAQAFNELQQALSEPSLAFGDQIWVAAGTYAPGANQLDTFQLVAGVEVYGGFPAGGGDGTFGARNPDPATNGTVLSGNLGGGATALVIITGPQPPNDEFTILDGFTVTAASQHATFNSNSKAAYVNLLITGNQNFGEGAGMRNEAGSKPVVTTCTFSSNDGSNGGAM